MTVTIKLLYSDISEYKTVYSVEGMKGYVIGAPDFELFFEVITHGNQFTAKENEHTVKEIKANDSGSIVKAIEYEIAESETSSTAAETQNQLEESDNQQQNNEAQDLKKEQDHTRDQDHTRYRDHARTQETQPELFDDSTNLKRTRSIGVNEWREKLKNKRINRWKNKFRRPLF